MQDVTGNIQQTDSKISEEISAPTTSEKIKIAVFDFDGTIIPTQSGMRLALDLTNSKHISKRDALRLIFWGLKYKAHLPYKESYPRELIFQPFAGKKAEEVDEYLDEFYTNYLDPIVRNRLMEIAEQLKVEDIELVVLSAAFTSILESFSKKRGFLHIVGTEMEVDEEGRYTGKVEGECVAGDQKITKLVEYANKTFGEDNWEIEFAFADHYTDRDLLEMAEYVCAIDPDDTLKHYAKKNDWEILEFKKRTEKKIKKQVKKQNKKEGKKGTFEQSARLETEEAGDKNDK